MKNTSRKIALNALIFVMLPLIWHPLAVGMEANNIIQTIRDLKSDPKGPFKSINWYCPDGKINAAQQPCDTPGGRQHATLKDPIKKLERDNGIYLNIILSGASKDEMWGPDNNPTRFRQYSLVQYLMAADDGWIYKKAKYYRGAIQAEDETAWGMGFLKEMLKDDSQIRQNFFLLREAFKDIPHSGNENKAKNIRSLSKSLSENIPAFMDLRVKLHGQPDAGDVNRVTAFVDKNSDKIDANNRELFNLLLKDLKTLYSDQGIWSLSISKKIAENPEIADEWKNFIKNRPLLPTTPGTFTRAAENPFVSISELLLKIRTGLEKIPAPHRLALMDLSIELENLLFLTIGNWEPETIGELMNKGRILLMASAGCGYIELWEWESADSACCRTETDQPTLFSDFKLKAYQMRQMVDWGGSMIRSVYAPEVALFSSFEPMANGFVDDRIRSSILLYAGDTMGRLIQQVRDLSVMPNQITGELAIGGLRAVNPGIAYGELEVVDTGAEEIIFDPKKIYAFRHFPTELSPVAGILAVSEGNLVSHVQLLARNLGIPNTVISTDNFNALKTFSGQKFFYAVSPNGVIVLKPDARLSSEERSLAEGKKRSEDKVKVPVEKINLHRTDLIPLSQLRSKDSGKICGPKAANLGQLKHLFPGAVDEGLIIPFGIFRQHMDQQMPETGMTYWQFLNASLSPGAPSSDVSSETRRLNDLAKLHLAVKKIPFLPEFEGNLRGRFESIFGHALGKLPVFIRSDTNMEDLKDFTGAGLNLTVFNVLDKERIYQGIKDVWASPYSERSYKWRQKFLKNPENVFPSILLLPSVNVDKSGVIITRGIVTLNPKDITIAFNRGAGGAVEGQTAESYLLMENNRDILLFPSRELSCMRLPATGGVLKEQVLLYHPVLSPKNMADLRTLVADVYRLVHGSPEIGGSGPYDIEMGFLNDKVHLFQIRPFVENKRAAATTYLQGLDAKIQIPLTIAMGNRLKDAHD